MKRTVPVASLFLIVTLTGLIIASSPVWSDTKRGIHTRTGRYALVIGNGAYPMSPLKNPVNDSMDIARLLGQLGFTVIHRHDVDIRSMETAVREFGHMLESGGTGLFYYAGHGMQVRGRNYLIPVDARIESESDVRYEALDVGRVLGKMEDADNGLNIVILDACRDNPFGRGYRSTRSGLARMDAPRGTLIAYATSPGSVAADGTGRNGIYTKNLLTHMATPGLPVEQIFKNVRINVIRDTNQKQVPWEASSLTGDFYFTSVIVDKPTERREKISSKELPNDSRTNPETIPTQTSTEVSKEKDTLLFAYAKDVSITPEIQLRKMSEHIKNQSDIDRMLTRYDFYEDARNPHGSFRNKFIEQSEEFVIDQRTGLMWQRAGSSYAKSFIGAKGYIEELNEEKFAGYTYWRLPTIEELASILDTVHPARLSNAHVFDKHQVRCWSIDLADGTHNHPTERAAWIVNFKNRTITKSSWFQGHTNSWVGSEINPLNYIRAVRSINQESE